MCLENEIGENRPSVAPKTSCQLAPSMLCPIAQKRNAANASFRLLCVLYLSLKK